jgi:superfamily II DNA or RNA helicase
MKLAKILISDEVNCKISGLDLDMRRKLTSKFSFEIPGAKYQPAVRLGRWNGKESFFAMGGSTFINLLPEILPILIDAGYEIELEDYRDYKRTFNFDKISETSFDNRAWPTGHPNEGQPILLRDYQVEAINTFLENPQCLQELATGFGKTITTAAMSATVEKYGRTIIIVPNKSLVTQTEADYKNMGLDTGVYFGDRKEQGRTHTICTWQSLNNLMKNTKDAMDSNSLTIGEFIEGVVCVIVDECHQAKASSLKTLLTGVMSQIPIRWGLTGTIPKEEYAFKSLQVSLGEVVGKLSASELQAEGHLADCHVNIIQLVDHREFKNYQAELKYLLETDDRLDTIAGLVSNIKQSGNTLVLVDRVAAGKELAKKLDEMPRKRLNDSIKESMNKKF